METLLGVPRVTGGIRSRSWDLWLLWNHLTNGYECYWYAIPAADIDGDGDSDWIDLGLLGDYLYGSGESPRHRRAVAAHG